MTGYAPSGVVTYSNGETVLGTASLASGVAVLEYAFGKAGAHARRLLIILTLLNVAKTPQAMNAPGFGLHPLKGDMKHHWSVSVSWNWRLTFKFEGEDAILVDYQDYH